MHLKIDFFKWIIIFLYMIRYILIDLSYIFPMQKSEFKISISVGSYDEKTALSNRNCWLMEKPIVFKLSKISITNFNSTNLRLESHIFNIIHWCALLYWVRCRVVYYRMYFHRVADFSYRFFVLQLKLQLIIFFIELNFFSHWNTCTFEIEY